MARATKNVRSELFRTCMESENREAQEKFDAIKKKICPFYLKGTCRQQLNCKWLHPENGQNTTSQQRSPRRTEPKLCPYFQSGRCNHGNSCKWIHADPQPEPSICPHFTLGKCFYGNNCKFQHPPHLGSDYTMMPYMGPPPLVGEPLMYNPMAYPPVNPYIIPYPIVNLSPQDDTRICRHWKEGYCHYENCRFLHLGLPGSNFQVTGQNTHNNRNNRNNSNNNRINNNNNNNTSANTETNTDTKKGQDKISKNSSSTEDEEKQIY